MRVVAINLQGVVLAQATRDYPLLTPHPGWTEQNPTDWVEASLQALTAVAQQLEAYQIIALGLSGQMHGMVALDADGKVIRPAILWNDQLTGSAVAEIAAKIPRKDLIQRTGNPAITGFQLPKIVWLRTQEAQAYATMHHVLLPKDYLGYVLTGEMATEASDASGVGCLNLRDRQWDVDILAELGIRNLFPQIIHSIATVGKLKPEIAKLTKLPPIPIIAGGGDNAAAEIGLGISSANLNQGSLSIGTSGVIFVPLQHPTPESEGRVHLFCHVDGGYYLLGVTLAAGGSLRWYRQLFPNSTYQELISLADKASPGSGGIIFLPHLAGERSPYLDADARGAWINLALAHTQADITRAVLEGVAYSLRATLDVINALAKLTAGIAPIDQLITTGGGAKSQIWLQIIADVLELKLGYLQSDAGAAYGAAILALVGAAAYPNLVAALKILPQVKEYILPHPNPVYQAAFERYNTFYTALKSVRE